MAHTSNQPIVDAWAKPALKKEVLPEVVRLFQQSGTAVSAEVCRGCGSQSGEARRSSPCIGASCQGIGVQGVTRRPLALESSPNDKFYFPLYVKCIELDIPFCTQVGHTGPLMPSETGRPVPYLDEVALTFPELRIVAGHIGHPWTDEMIGVAWKHENVFIDTSAYLPRYYHPQLVHYLKTYGQDKVLFGTNFPQLSFVIRAASFAKNLA